ncbi:YceI family protein [Mucilaginibacter myungsuensis]|uniref:YceI family protein n=1 Tax=Mucilaginibacter myungsuensis TaxID=649104 RepID=A0A929KW51_9SPHI|nr:YceI family protein [Mucilaginibacter myungsuensis]MBE9661555.1 YceI family protein [Mucilaginibacter myungsuensis]MDN3597698.1 YceI family protein [Mucilaginibacter myungsuensis]
MKQIFALIALTFAVGLADAQTKHTLTKATVEFKLKNMGFNTGGVIEKVEADINFSKDKPEASAITATADANSINTENDMRDGHLKKPEYFDVTKYPKITMKSVSFKSKGANNFIGVFNVTIKDKTKAIEVPFTYVATDNKADFKGKFKLNRLDFGVGGKSAMMGNDITVELDIQTTTS